MDLIKTAFDKVRQDMDTLQYQIDLIYQEIQEIKRTLKSQTDEEKTSTDKLKTSTDSTDNYPLEASKSPISNISTGNEGVSTDKQTNRQTDRHIQKFAQVIENLDEIKSELRIKFKKLTPQEMLIFSTIYQFEEQGFTVDYPSLSEKLNLSESSIRDYVQRLIKKGIPIEKTKHDNKKITLSIPLELKKMASLDTILQLREPSR